MANTPTPKAPTVPSGLLPSVPNSIEGLLLSLLPVVAGILVGQNLVTGATAAAISEVGGVVLGALFMVLHLLHIRTELGK